MLLDEFLELFAELASTAKFGLRFDRASSLDGDARLRTVGDDCFCPIEFVAARKFDAACDYLRDLSGEDSERLDYSSELLELSELDTAIIAQAADRTPKNRLELQYLFKVADAKYYVLVCLTRARLLRAAGLH